MLKLKDIQRKSKKQEMTNIAKEKIAFKGPVKYVYKKMGRAIADYKMLSQGDTILINVSGSLDSLSLVELFLIRKQRIPIDFNLLVCFIDINFIQVDKEVVLRHLEGLKVPYVIKSLTLDEKEVNCFSCSLNRRRILFETAREYRCNKIALGHNLDDIIETTMMNIFFKSEVSTMKPSLELFNGAITLIRPLCYLTKDEIMQFVSCFNFPDAGYECRFGNDSQRKRIKDMIKDLSVQYPFVKQNIFGAMGRIRKDYLL
jgi:tRNA 2-thiocytidine biosynthesis protein TtcA